MSSQDILEKLQKASANLQTNEGYAKATESIYHTLELVSSLLLAWKHADGQPGWSRQVLNKQGQPLFSEQESQTVESAFVSMQPQLKNLFASEDVQRGGGPDSVLQDVQMPTHPNPIVDKDPSLGPGQISLDGVYYGLMDTLDKYDEQAREFARQSGILKFESCLDDQGEPMAACPDIMVGSVPVPRRLILPLLTGILDMLRLALGNPMWDMPIVRILLSISLGTIDLMRGEWKTGILSLLGVISANANVLSFFLRIVRNTWLMMSPDLQVRLRDDLYKSSKSIVVGFYLWCFTFVAPMPIRSAVSQAFSKLNAFGKSLLDQIKGVEKTLQPPPGSRVKIIFPKLPMETLPTLDDIQNLQTLMHEPLLVCSKEIQDIIQQQVVPVVPLRLILELMGVPIVDKDVALTCGEDGVQPIGTKISELATKIQVIMPPAEAAPATATAAEDPNEAGAAAPNAESDPVTSNENPAATKPNKANKGGKRKTPRRRRSAGKKTRRSQRKRA